MILFKKLIKDRVQNQFITVVSYTFQSPIIY